MLQEVNSDCAEVFTVGETLARCKRPLYYAGPRPHLSSKLFTPSKNPECKCVRDFYFFTFH